MSKEVLVCGFSDTSALAKNVAKILSCSYSDISVNTFPDGESLVKINISPKGKKVVIVASLAHNPDIKVVQTLLAGGVARDNGAKKVFLMATYMPYLRQDKSFHDFECVQLRKL
mgnify:FL=1